MKKSKFSDTQIVSILNEAEAGLSDYTSIQQRIRRDLDTELRLALKKSTQDDASSSGAAAKPALMRFSGRMDRENELPLSLKDYLELVDWSGRAIHPDKKGSIPEHYPKIINRLKISPEALVKYLSREDKDFRNVIGKPKAMRQAAQQLGRAFLHGISAAQRLFPDIA